jgi:ribosomal protein S18 acetylase RimI-like enzyme
VRSLSFDDPVVQERASAILAEVARNPVFLTLIADLSTLGPRCSFCVSDEGALAARYVDLPFAALSFYGEGQGLARVLAGLLAPGESCYTLVAAGQRAQLAAVATELDVVPEWQMMHRGDTADLDPRDARPLVLDDLPAMRALAARGDMHAFKERSLDGGPYYGVWRDGRLVAMAGTRLQVEGMAEIGNVVTDPGYRRRGLARAVLAATMRALYERVPAVLLHVVETNAKALSLYKSVGFARSQMMYLVQFVR